MTMRITAAVTVALLGLVVFVASVGAAMAPYVCPDTPCTECRYEGIGEVKLAAALGQLCDFVNKTCSGTLMCCPKVEKEEQKFRCSVPVATAPRNGSCPPRRAVKTRSQCPEDGGLCNYDSECEKPGHKCCTAYECCGNMLKCKMRKCVPAVYL